MPRVVYVTCGTDGAGHLVRGAALGLALERAGYSGDFRIVSPIAAPAAMRAAMATFAPIVCPIDTREVLDSNRAGDSALAAALKQLAPDLIIVDLFWAPLLHIRPECDCDAWLIVRSCPPIWLRGNDEVRFDPSHYQRVIGIEPVEHEEIREHIDPIVVCNPDQSRTREEFCERFGLDSRRSIAVFSHAGLPGEIDLLKQLDGDQWSIVRCDLHSANAVFPLAPWLVDVDRVHCSAGYNSYWEARWLGFAERTAFTVFRRKIDDPLWRVKANQGVVMRRNGADTLAEQIMTHVEGS